MLYLRALPYSLFVATVSLGQPADSKVVAAPKSVTQAIFDGTNAFRSESDLPPLTQAPKLNQSAQSFAEYLARTGEFSHRAGGTSPMDRAREAGYSASYIAENIAWNDFRKQGAALAKEFVDGWIDSPGHKANMLAATPTEIGIGVATNTENGRHYAVQVFGLPAGSQPPMAATGQPRGQKPVTTPKADEVPAAKNTSTPDLAAVKQQILEGTNRLREREGRGKVTLEAKLSDAAKQFAEYLAKTEQFDHNAGGTTPRERATKAGYESCIILENLGMMWGTAAYSVEQLSTDFVEGWWNSKGHRENLLNPRVTEIGIGVIRGENGKYYGVQLFGLPKTAEFEFRINNRTAAEVTIKVDEQEFKIRPQVTLIITSCGQAELAHGDQTFTVTEGDRFEVVIGSDGEPKLRTPSNN